ncbi:flagellar hook-basal body complex protein, partial [Aeromonas salmonicida]|uniref:flagellar hook-basal body complex protein n=2 Tax=Aeromonadaceae TaxID=84642 RepID=UPI00111AB8C7
TGAVAQQFQQGALKFTENPLDLAVQGNGFFVLSDGKDNLDRTFTRAGAFKLDANSYIVNNQGNFLQGYEINDDGTPKAVSLNATKPIQIPDKAGEPVRTTTVNASFNLPSNTDALDVGKFDPKDSKTYSSSTSVVVYDSLGEPYTVTKYFVKELDTGTGQAKIPTTWRMFLYSNDKPIDIVGGVATTPVAPATQQPLGATIE